MVICCVPGCTNVSAKGKYLKFFRFPSNEEERQKWLEQLGLDDVSTNARVCGRHFARGTKSTTGVIPTLSKTKPSFSVAAIKRSRVRASFTWSPSKQTPPLKRLAARVISRPRRPKSSTPKKNVAACRRSLSLISPIREHEDRDVDVAEDFEDMFHSLSIDVEPHSDCASCFELQEELKEKENCIKLLEQQMSSGENWRVEAIQDNDEKTLFYTGFRSYNDFNGFFKSLEYAATSLKYWSQRHTAFTESKSAKLRSLSPLNEFFLTMVRLRLGLEMKDLSYRFGFSLSQVHNIFVTWINFLYCHLNDVDWWLPRDTLRRSLPQSFREAFPKTTCIIDATELFTERPSDRGLQSAFFSSYKHHHTVKALVAISPCGHVMFVSRLFTGAISDRELTKQSGFLNKLVPGDQVMADKGFITADILMDVGASLVLPPFLKGGGQFAEEQVIKCRQVASLRIDVERVIRRIKNYRILQGITLSSSMDLLDKVFTVCSYLTNLHPPLVR